MAEGFGFVDVGVDEGNGGADRKGCGVCVLLEMGDTILNSVQKERACFISNLYTGLILTFLFSHELLFLSI